MVTSDELDRLFLAGINDPTHELEFFQAFLEAIVFAHGPLEEADPAKLHFVMFRSPDDKEWVIPVFTDRAKIERASSSTVRILEMTGRQLLDLTRGAAIMLNPNDWQCTLFREEIAQLLDHGILPPVQRFQIEHDGDGCVYCLEVVPRAIRKAVKKALSGIANVEVAYIAGSRWKSGEPDGVIVAVGGTALSGEHAARAIASTLQLSLEPIDRGVDVTYFGPNMPEPPWIKDLKVPAMYRRKRSNAQKRNRHFN